MLDLNVEITGRTPLLMHAFTDEAMASATEGTRAAVTGDKGTPREQAAASLYIGQDGHIVIPQPNLFRCIIDAGKFFKAGKSKITTLKTSLIPSCLDMPAVEYLLAHDGWEVDSRPVRIPATGGRIVRHRARFDAWSLTFEAQLDTAVMSAKLLREIVDKAGAAIGLGDFRPDCKGPFGKFCVTRWVETPAAMAIAAE